MSEKEKLAYEMYLAQKAREKRLVRMYNTRQALSVLR